MKVNYGETFENLADMFEAMKFNIEQENKGEFNNYVAPFDLMYKKVLEDLVKKQKVTIKQVGVATAQQVQIVKQKATEHSSLTNLMS